MSTVALWTCANGHENHPTREVCGVCGEGRPARAAAALAVAVQPMQQPSLLRRSWRDGTLGVAVLVLVAAAIVLAVVLNDGGSQSAPISTDEARQQTRNNGNESSSLQREAEDLFRSNYLTTSWYPAIRLIAVRAPTLRVEANLTGDSRSNPSASGLCIAVISFAARHPEVSQIQVRGPNNDDLCPDAPLP